MDLVVAISDTIYEGNILRVAEQDRPESGSLNLVVVLNGLCPGRFMPKIFPEKNALLVYFCQYTC